MQRGTGTGSPTERFEAGRNDLSRRVSSLVMSSAAMACGSTVQRFVSAALGLALALTLATAARPAPAAADPAKAAPTVDMSGGYAGSFSPSAAMSTPACT